MAIASPPIAGWGTLDYRHAQITMRAVSKWEQNYRLHACAKEPWTVEWIESIDPATSIFWDIGANTGPYSLIAGSRGIRTYAFEPGYNNYAAGQDNVLANPTSTPYITVLPLALSDATGLVPFFYRDLEPGAASHGFGEGNGKMVAQLPAVAITADAAIAAIGLPQPTHIKVDVDGAESRVLAGFGDRLSLVHEIMIEVPNAGAETDTIHSLLAARGFASPAIFNERAGQTIGNIHYELWVRGA